MEKDPTVAGTAASDLAESQIDGADQYLRVCKLLVVGKISSLDSRNRDALDLSKLRIKFLVKRSDTETPNTADIRVYNLSEETALTIRKEFTSVILEAGYRGNSGVIFRGNIRQVVLGRENATDTFIDIIAGDGDRSYNYSVVNLTLAKGSKPIDQVNAATDAMKSRGATPGNLGDFPSNELPRGKVMFGNAKDYLRNSAITARKTWSIQDEKITFVPVDSYLPGTRVVLTSDTGIIGTPQQTNWGVNVKCLLNPFIQIGGLVVIDNKSVEQQKLNLDQITAASVAAKTTDDRTKAINDLTPRFLSADGTYKVLTIELTGDTRGVPWYSSLVCLRTDISANPLNSVSGN